MQKNSARKYTQERYHVAILALMQAYLVLIMEDHLKAHSRRAD